MTKLRYLTLDVFTSTPYSGNPLAVVFLPEDDSQALTQRQKHIMTLEFNLSETIFVYPTVEKSKRSIDIFTIEGELPFAGHPTIGAATWFLCHGPDAAGGAVKTLGTKSGDIQISVQDAASKYVAASIAHNTHIHAARFPGKELLRLHPTLVPFLSQDSSFPLFSIVKGMSQVFIELPSLEALSVVTTSTGGELVSTETSGFLDEGWRVEGLICIYFFVRDVEDNVMKQKVIRTRMMLGNLEDPATGSSASGLASYLTLTEGEAEKERRYHFVQGVEMGRRSDIGVNVTLDAGKKIEKVELTGTAVEVSEGHILVPEEK